jgi:CheY-like chemotaxis protein
MSRKILVIDDGLAASRLTETVVSENFSGCDVLIAQRGSDGFDRFNVAQPDLILLDDSLPDMDSEAVCYRLLNDPATAHVPVVVMASNGNGKILQERYKNVVQTITKPVTPEALRAVVNKALADAQPQPPPTSVILFHDPAKTVFSGHTGFFSLRSTLAMAFADKLNGVLRFFINRVPIELFVSRGRFVFATTRNFQLYMKESPVILSSTNLGLILEAQIAQHATGCPLFLFLAIRNGFPHDDVVQITRDHGQRLFAHLWTAGRVTFEFEEMHTFPDFARNFPPTEEDPDNWMLASLRYVKYESLMPSQRPDPAGNPSYTRKGYELIQRLRLNDVEARFAQSINGSESLQDIAKKIGVTLNDALLIVFRFQTLEIIDYWSPNALALPVASPAGAA